MKYPLELQKIHQVLGGMSIRDPQNFLIAADRLEESGDERLAGLCKTFARPLPKDEKEICERLGLDYQRYQAAYQGGRSSGKTTRTVVRILDDYLNGTSETVWFTAHRSVHAEWLSRAIVELAIKASIFIEPGRIRFCGTTRGVYPKPKYVYRDPSI